MQLVLAVMMVITVNIIAGDACTTRISNPTSNVNVAGTNIVSNRGDGSLYWNTGNHTVSITGTVSNITLDRKWNT